MSYEEVVFERSYLNLILLNRAIPGYKPYDEDGGKDDENDTTVDKRKRKKKKTNVSTHANDFFMNFM